MPVAPGAAFGSKYVIQSVLGQGAFGTVYLARHTTADRTVVLKLFPANDPDRFARFEAEASVLARLDHPNIVRGFDHGVIDGCGYLELEWVDGVTLREVLGGSPLAHADALQVGVTIAGALRCAHECGIIHRDLKPANIIVPRRPVTSRFAEIKLTDFGVAGTLDLDSQRTRAGMTFGTPFYMSPEQVAGKPQTARTDVYAVGLLLYEMLTGRRFRTGDDTIALFRAILGGEVPAGDWGIPPRL